MVSFCKYQLQALEKEKLLKAECGGSDDHTSHKQRTSPLYIQGRRVRVSQDPLPALPHNLLLLAHPGDSKTVQTLKECHLTVPGDMPIFAKTSVPKSVYFELSYNHRRILPEGLLLPDAQVPSPGAKVGFVLETANTTRRCEQKLCQLVLSPIFTSKPKTKHQVVKSSHKADGITASKHPMQMIRIFKNLCWVY